MKTLRILLYTDTLATVKNGGEGDEGTNIMQRLLKAKLKNIVDVEVSVIARHAYENKFPCHGATKLTKELLNNFDEVWVFGTENVRNTECEPAHELTDQEVKALCAWMKTGGVMITGDHSQPGDGQDCENPEQHKDFLARGFSLGHRIPRAGQLRVWQGPPTNCHVEPADTSDTQNTLSKVGSEIEQELLQSDDMPQLLEEMEPPHFLFFYRLDEGGQPVQIRNFPDHQHEGRVLIPQAFDGCWPPRPPMPEVVARGRDQRFPSNPRIYDLVVAYDGDDAGVGRIVADTSFHHFINLNLCKIPTMDAVGNPVPGTPLDEIAQFYANLAYWLAPADLRDGVRKELFFRASTHIIVLEALGNSTSFVGQAAKAALASEVGVANVWRILEAGGKEQHPQERLLSRAFAGNVAAEEFEGLSEEFALGATVESYHEHFRERRLDPLNLLEDPTPPDFLSEGLERAFSARRAAAERLRSKPLDKPETSGGEVTTSPKAPTEEGGDA
jgi:hypothetical protein